MPELPDLEIIREVLARRIIGRRIAGVQVLRPLVLRSLEPEVASEGLLAGCTIVDVLRRGKILLLQLDNGAWVAVNSMLAGRLHLNSSRARRRSRDYLVLEFDDGVELCYHDRKGMGKIYIVRDLSLIPGYARLGPEPLDPELTLAEFTERLKGYRGEVKGVLTRGALVAGIGNAYADEILFQAGVYPFRRVTSLSHDERINLYVAMRRTLSQATDALRERVGEDIHIEIREALQVHNRKGQPCPRCGTRISEIKVGGRATSFCRHCQPGSLLE